MSARFTSNYDTKDEIDYIQGIGSFRVVGRKKYTKGQLLSFYKDSLKRRKQWSNINKDAIFECLEKEIENNP